ncbi:MAG: STAS domain-containing protein [Solobacterium sp.]|nr:STAS domain-containing protein [Erysipelotrichaceae bacterium]MCI6700398.1 STAS domain-containing protein [Solobacterium sp.]MCI7732213.1 STAS domain-containing protein [Solobacterium sp.]MDD5842437.1 STAS domain-containing protein [Solobacterium sp.]MDD6121560.1 STAS domain-containing protein [Solobacterium sp.]
MDINKVADNGKLKVAISGRLDTTTAPELEKELDFTGITSVEFDLADLEYVSSAGLRVILMVQKNMKGNFVLKNVKPEIMEIFEITGFADILTIE